MTNLEENQQSSTQSMVTTITPQAQELSFQ